MPILSGIYYIQSKEHPERKYIGSAANFNWRKSKHLSDLRKNKHHSIKLQRHFNKYGEDDLIFILKEECDKSQLLEIEQHYLDNEKPFFNTCIVAGSSLGLHWTLSEESRKNISEGHRGTKHSEESKIKRSKKLKGRKPSDLARKRSSEVHKGKKLSEEQIELMRARAIGNSYAKGKRWRLSEETKAKMRASALKNKNEKHFIKKDGST